ncbi:MAG: dTMP kinase [Firmicutes bacterium]|nr:dTMP kinase [Bacillota bacterium]
MKGKLVSVEGLDGAGKTLLVEGLAEKIRQRGIPVTVIREPGGSEVSERIRGVLLDPQNEAMASTTEALLYLAARAQLVAEVIQPALEAGKFLLCDRFTDSTLAYQGGGRGLDRDMLAALNLMAADGVVPDRTILLDIDPQLGRQRRLAGRGEVMEDRLESESMAFYQRVRESYLEIARQEPRRVYLVDAEKSPAAVLARAWEIVEGVLDSGKG